MNSIQQNGRKEILTDEQASSWKKAMNSTQQNGNTEMLMGEQASSWEKAMNSIQRNGRKEMLADEHASSWRKTLALAQIKKSLYNAQGKERTQIKVLMSNTRPRRAGGFDLLWTQFKGMEAQKCSRAK